MRAEPRFGMLDDYMPSQHTHTHFVTIFCLFYCVSSLLPAASLSPSLSHVYSIIEEIISTAPCTKKFLTKDWCFLWVAAFEFEFKYVLLPLPTIDCAVRMTIEELNGMTNTNLFFFRGTTILSVNHKVLHRIRRSVMWADTRQEEKSIKSNVLCNFAHVILVSA